MSLLHPRVASLGPELPHLDRSARDVRSEAAAEALRGGFAVERLDAVAAAAHRDAWLDLVDRALEPNVFLDPDFALPAARHLAVRRRPCFVLVWTIVGGERRHLVAVCPVVERQGALRGLASAWIHDLATLGVPLLDRVRAVPALRALLSWAGAHLRGASGLVVPSLPADGATVVALRAVAEAGGLGLATLDRWQRAALRPGRPAGLDALSTKGAKELRRQRRRLSECGVLEQETADTAETARDAVERFLALEAGGWKGSAGTAMLCRPDRTAFLRVATRMLVRRGLCRVDSLTLDGAPVAMAVTLSAGDVDFLWKIAYREDVARASPGVQLVLAITEGGRRDGRAVTTDSCAIPDHPMIDRLWRDRIALCDVAVMVRPGGAGAFRRAVAVERAARRVRSEAKRILLAWRARRAPAAH